MVQLLEGDVGAGEFGWGRQVGDGELGDMRVTMAASVADRTVWGGRGGVGAVVSQNPGDNFRSWFEELAFECIQESFLCLSRVGLVNE